LRNSSDTRNPMRLCRVLLRFRACLAGLRLLQKRLRLLCWSGFSDGVEAILENVWQNGFTCWIEVVKCQNCPFLFFFFFPFSYFLFPLLLFSSLFPLLFPFSPFSPLFIHPHDLTYPSTTVRSSPCLHRRRLLSSSTPPPRQLHPADGSAPPPLRLGPASADGSAPPRLLTPHPASAACPLPPAAPPRPAGASAPPSRASPTPAVDGENPST
jgi:hypothetical protein